MKDDPSQEKQTEQEQTMKTEREKGHNMTNQEKLQAWVENEKKKGLIDIKLYPGEIAQSSVEGLCTSILGVIDAREQNKRTKITKL